MSRHSLPRPHHTYQSTAQAQSEEATPLAALGRSTITVLLLVSSRSVDGLLAGQIHNQTQQGHR
ncbi:MAG: hypothetical protein M3036_04820, partial [Bifidobacteriales bacterium]|nr:hypothetical protein [Bifidobacteriales bacterium]